MKKTHIALITLILILAIVGFVNKSNNTKTAKNNINNTVEENEKIEEKHPQDSVFYIVNPEKSTLEWRATQNMIKNEHNGTVDISQGVIVYSKDNFVGGDFVVDMTTINDNEDNEFLEKHLKSDDFFDVENHATAKLKLLEVNPTDLEDIYKIKANLTIKKITNPIEFDARVVYNPETLQANAIFAIDRTKWDIRYGSGKFFEDIGDKIIDDKIEFTVNILAEI